MHHVRYIETYRRGGRCPPCGVYARRKTKKKNKTKRQRRRYCGATTREEKRKINVFWAHNGWCAAAAVYTHLSRGRKSALNTRRGTRPLPFGLERRKKKKTTRFVRARIVSAENALDDFPARERAQWSREGRFRGQNKNRTRDEFTRKNNIYVREFAAILEPKAFITCTILLSRTRDNGANVVKLRVQRCNYVFQIVTKRRSENNSIKALSSTRERRGIIFLATRKVWKIVKST